VLTVWFVLLIIGWAMIYQPVLGTAIRASSGGVTDTSWATAIYYSGYLITTLGTGGVVPKTGLYRLLAILETASGFVTISMVITYFMSVYSSLTTRNAFAQGVHHATANTDDAAQLLVMLADGADLSDARSYLATTAASLRQIFQTHRSYPVLRYFHYREPYYALPRILLTVLDTTALCASALDRQRYSNIIDSAALYELRAAALALLHELIPAVESRTPTSSDNEQWAERYRAATTQLAAAVCTPAPTSPTEPATTCRTAPTGTAPCATWPTRSCTPGTPHPAHHPPKRHSRQASRATSRPRR